jgi:ring-1,2-phenylacetyl-CoA epoxidase subunit PaaE
MEKMVNNHTFIVIKKYFVTNSTISFDLQLEDKKIFSFIAGQFIVLKIHINGLDYKRSYSISSIPNQTNNIITITVKIIDNGIISNYLLNSINEGSILHAEGPFGEFVIDEQKSTKNYFFWAAGSGITPIYSIIKYLIHANLECKITLFYSVKNKDEIFFMEDLDKLFKNKVINLIYFSNNPICESSLPKIDVELCNKLINSNIYNSDQFSENYICGPNLYKNLITNCLIENKKDSKIKHESFSIKDDIELIKPLFINSKISIKSFRKNIEISSTKGETILDSIIKSEYKIDHSCMTGTCGLCKMNLYEGEAIDKNQIVFKNVQVLCCQVFPITNEIKLF